MYESCLQALRGENIELFEFAGSNAPRRRDDAIRQFQSQSFHKPAVFVITLGSGNVGITLTAASRVYLLEPSIDPSTHLQAAGRIHRLGQNKAVQCIKFVFRNSVESNIVDLHHEIAAGNISIADGYFPPEAVHILARGIGSRTHSE
jgi:SNF2 family DNA or RNA helicase